MQRQCRSRQRQRCRLSNFEVQRRSHTSNILDNQQFHRHFRLYFNQHRRQSLSPEVLRSFQLLLASNGPGLPHLRSSRGSNSPNNGSKPNLGSSSHPPTPQQQLSATCHLNALLNRGLVGCAEILRRMQSLLLVAAEMPWRGHREMLTLQASSSTSHLPTTLTFHKIVPCRRRLEQLARATTRSISEQPAPAEVLSCSRKYTGRNMMLLIHRRFSILKAISISKTTCNVLGARHLARRQPLGTAQATAMPSFHLHQRCISQ